MEKKSDTLICPYCNSDNVIKKKQPGYVVMLCLMLLRLPVPCFQKSFYCFDCGKEWKAKRGKVL